MEFNVFEGRTSLKMCYFFNSVHCAEPTANIGLINKSDKIFSSDEGAIRYHKSLKPMFGFDM